LKFLKFLNTILSKTYKYLITTGVICESGALTLCPNLHQPNILNLTEEVRRVFEPTEI